MPNSQRPVLILLLLLNAAAAAADLRFAHGLYRDRRYALAADEYRKFLAENPNDPKADEGRYFLGESLVQVQKLAEAAQAYESVTNASPAYRKDALFRAGTIRKRAGEVEKALRSLERFTAEFPGDDRAPAAWLLLADCRLSQKQPEAAAQALRKARLNIEEGSRWWGRLKLTEAELQKATGRGEAAIETLRALAASRDPLASDASLRLGGLLFEERQFTEAAAAYDQAAASSKDQNLADRARYNAGLCFLELKNWAEAARRLASVFGASPPKDDAEGVLLAAQAGQALVQVSRGAGDRAKARSTVEAALRRFSGTDVELVFKRLGAELDLDEGRAVQAAPVLRELLNRPSEGHDRPALVAAACRAAVATGDSKWATELLRELPAGTARVNAERALGEAEWKDTAAVESILGIIQDRLAWARLTYRLAALEVEASKLADAVTRLQTLRRTKDLPADLRANVNFLLGGALVQLDHWGDGLAPLEEYLQAALKPNASADPESLASAARWWARCLTWLSDADAQKRMEPFLAIANRSLFETVAVSFAAERRAELALWLLGRLAPPETKASAAIAARCLLELKRPREALERIPTPGTPEEHYLAGVAWLQLGDSTSVATGRAMLERVADAAPPSPWSVDAALRLARAAKTAAEAAEAERRLSRLAASAPGPHQRRLRLESAFLAAAAGRPLQAIADLRTFIDQESAAPEAVEAALKLADLHESRGEAVQAREALDRAEQLDAVRQASGPLLFRRAALAYRSRDWRTAETLLAEFLSKFPKDDAATDASLMLAEVALEQQRADEAVRRFTALKETGDATVRSTATLRLAQALLLGNKYDDAERAVDEFLRLAGQPPGQIAEAHFVRGRALMHRAKFDAARAAFGAAGADEATELGSKARFMMGETYFHQRKHEAAVKEYLKVVVLGKDDGWRAAAILQVGKCHENLGDLAAAAEDYRRILDQFPTTPAAKQARDRLEQVQLGARNSPRNGVKEQR